MSNTAKFLVDLGLSLGGTPPGLTQLRHLLKLRKKQRKAMRYWRGRRRLLDDDDDDDWDDFLWGNRAA